VFAGYRGPSFFWDVLGPTLIGVRQDAPKNADVRVETGWYAAERFGSRVPTRIGLFIFRI